MHQIYPLVVPIETNRGRGETRAVGPTRITFAIAALFETGDDLRFTLSLQGNGKSPVDVAGSGRVSAVAAEGHLFVVDAAIDQTQITLAKGEGERA